jgi:uncharacterized membrane protein YqjE
MNERERRRTEEVQAHSGPQNVPTVDLINLITDDAKTLVRMEVELARVEAKVDLNAELDLAKGAVIAAVCGLLGLNMLIMSAVLALAPQYAWVAALVVGLVLLAIGGIAAYIGWQHAEKDPLSSTRESLKENVIWLRKQIS